MKPVVFTEQDRREFEERYPGAKRHWSAEAKSYQYHEYNYAFAGWLARGESIMKSQEKIIFSVGDVVEITESRRPCLIPGDRLTLVRYDEDGGWRASLKGALGDFLGDFCIGQNDSKNQVKFRKTAIETESKKSEDDLRDELMTKTRELSDASSKSLSYESAFRQLHAYISGYFHECQRSPVKLFADELKSRVEKETG